MLFSLGNGWEEQLITEDSRVKVVNLTSFHELLKQSFNGTEFHTLCAELGVDYEDLLANERAGKMRELIFYLSRRERLAALIVRLQELRPAVAWSAVVEIVDARQPTAVPVKIPFTNRENELQLIQTLLGPAYFILDAPAGFGKTALLKQLYTHFTENDWLCAYTAVDEHSTLPDLVKALADELNITHLLAKKPGAEFLSQSRDTRPWGMRFGVALQKHWDDLEKQGLVLLIDLDQHAPTAIAKGLIDEFIPQVYSCLRALKTFTRKQNRFRIVLAGRALAPPPKTIVPIPLRIIEMHPFSYATLRDATRQFLPQLAEDAIDQLAAHIFHLTGGHPGSASAALEIFQQQGGTPDFFMQFLGESIWRDVVRPFVEEIQENLGHRSEILTELGLLRYSNYTVLDQIVRARCLNYAGTAHELADDLTINYLLNRNGRFLTDDLTRRLFAIQKQWQHKTTYTQLCLEAQSICANELREESIQSPEIWTIEYLFQFLQQHAIVQDPARRPEIREEFFQHQVPTALKLFMEARSVKHRLEEYQALNQQIDTDWEFRFAVNYYLRDHQYADNNAYTRLQRQINHYFT